MSTPAPSAPVMRASPVMGAGEWLLLVILSLLWGGSFFFGQIAVAEWPPLAVVLGRVGLAAVALLIVVGLTGHSMALGGRLWLAFFAMGVLNNLIPFSLILWGQTHIASGLASILNATTPIFSVMVTHVLAGERAGRVKLAGCAAGLAGVAVLMGPDAIAGLGGDLLPQIACLGAALSYAFAGLFGRRFKGLSPLVSATGQLSATTLMAMPIVLILHPPWSLPTLSLKAGLSLAAFALASTALAYIIFFRILARAGATNAVLVTFLIPPSAILLGSGFLGEALLPRHFVGMAAIFLGLMLIDGRLPARLTSPRSSVGRTDGP